MRIAICFSGELRTAVHTAPQILKWIGPLVDQCDFFIHTWNLNTYKCAQPNLHKCVKLIGNINLGYYDRNKHKHVLVENEELACIKNLYKPKALIVDDYQNVSNHWISYWKKNYFSQFNLVDEPGNYWNPLYYSFYRSIELKRMYERQNNFLYDMVLKLRPDVSYLLTAEPSPIIGHPGPKKSTLEYELNNLLNDNSKLYWNETTDFWYGSSKIMNIAATHWISNLSQLRLTMKEHCNANGIPADYAHTNQIAYNRLFFKQVDANDWLLIYMLEKLFNDYNFYDMLKTSISNEWRLKLKKSLLDDKVMDIFCDTFGCSYSVNN
jgi:hypothetical protein